MAADIQPGELVVRRLRWHPESSLIGVVIGHSEGQERNWLVMWTLEDRRVDFSWHLEDALLLVDPSNVNELRKRCSLGT